MFPRSPHGTAPCLRSAGTHGSVLFANSDLFPALLQRELRKLGVLVGGYLRLDEVPDGVSVDTSGFLTKVTITLE